MGHFAAPECLERALENIRDVTTLADGGISIGVGWSPDTGAWSVVSTVSLSKPWVRSLHPIWNTELVTKDTDCGELAKEVYERLLQAGNKPVD